MPGLGGWAQSDTQNCCVMCRSVETAMKSRTAEHIKKAFDNAIKPALIAVFSAG